MPDVAQRIKAFIAPRNPCTPAERAAFDMACELQNEYEQRNNTDYVPAGVSSFTVNGFSATFSGNARLREIFPMGLSPDARAELFNAGLLYRGVDLC